MGKTDLHRYALAHFQININYKYTATPHGNCKKSRKPYLKTMSSTIESLKISASSKKPKSTYIDKMVKVGKTTSPSELPKNHNQANYARNLVKNKFESVSNTGDDLLQAIYKCKKSGEKFVREVQSAPEGIVVISSDIQIKDVARFCALPPKRVGEVFSVDLTFKLGDLYVTVTSCRNPMLINKEGTHPTYIGPVQIQHSCFCHIIVLRAF